MKAKRILVSWVGLADLRAFAALSSAADRKVLGSFVDKWENSSTQGPIQTLLSFETFDEIHLLCNYGRKTASVIDARMNEI